MSVVLETKGLSKSYAIGRNQEVPVLRGVDLSVEKGEFLAVMGPSGSGKSTLLYNLSGMDRMSSGTVLFKEQQLETLSEAALARLRLEEMGFIFQQIHLLKNLDLYDNIVLSGYLATPRKRKFLDRRARELMELTGIEGLERHGISEASGGQLQRVGICRALINEPEMIFGDEPTGALDSKSAAEIMELLSEINRRGTTILLVTHDIKVASKCDRVLFMMDGRLEAEARLGRFQGAQSEAKLREERLAAWLLEQGL